MLPIIILSLCAAAAAVGLFLVLRGVLHFPTFDEPPATQRVPVPVDVRVSR